MLEGSVEVLRLDRGCHLLDLPLDLLAVGLFPNQVDEEKQHEQGRDARQTIGKAPIACPGPEDAHDDRRHAKQQVDR